MTQYQQHELSRIDGEIAELEKKIAVKHEQRRELVNRMGLNKCQHKNSTCVDVTAMSDAKPKLSCHCDDCGCQLPWQHTELKP